MIEKIREGDVHKVFTVDNVTFEIRYGYHSPEERKRGWEPTPIYPDFTEAEQYTPEGFPFASVYQDICKHYKPNKTAQAEEWCENCLYFEKCETYIGVCRYEARRKNNGNASDKLISNPDENNYSFNQTTIKEAK